MSNKMINVLYITSEKGKPLGSAHSLANMIQSLAEFVEPIVIVRDDKAKPFFESKGIKTIAVKYPIDITDKKGLSKVINFFPRLCRDIISYTTAIIKLRSISRKYKIDIIHSNNSIVTIGHYLSIVERKPHVWHIREFIDLDFHWSPFLGWNRLKRSIKKSEAIICVSAALTKHFNLVDSLNAYQLYNAVRSKNECSYIKDKDNYFLMCGNISSAKGADIAIKSFALFNKTYPGYRLKLVGTINYEYKEILKSLASELKILDLIDFEGYQENTKTYYEKAVGFLMCSKHEAMGRVTVEAMFYGCPVIGFNGGGTAEIIQDGKTGYLFNTIEECAFLMGKVITSNQEPIIKNALKEAEDSFSIESYGEKILDVYQSLLKKFSS